MADRQPAKSLADLAAEQGIGPIRSIDELAAKDESILSDEEWVAWQTAMRRRDDESPTASELARIVQALVGEYVTLGNTIGGDIRVPKDLRDAVEGQVAEILEALPARLKQATEPEDARP